MEVENGCLEDDWLVSFWGPFSTSIMGGRVTTSLLVPADLPGVLNEVIDEGGHPVRQQQNHRLISETLLQ